MTLAYGDLRFGKTSWGIRCEPHVRAHLKRVFPRISVTSKDIILSANPENSRNLQWFMQRYPLSMDAPTAAALDKLAREHIDMEQRLSDLLTSRVPPSHVELAVPAREYQLFAATMLETRGGLLLADDVGLGKTVSAICAMVKPANLPAVVVCPAHMPDQWAAYIARFAPSLRVHKARKSQPYPLTSKRLQADLWPDQLPDVIITSYHKLRGWAPTLAEVAQLVVFDECQALRSGSSYIYAAASLLARRCRLRLGLSATPVYNYGSEFWSVVDVLLPDTLGDYYEFIREWCTAAPGGKSKLQDSELFGAYLRREGIMLRRTRADVGRELPDLTKVVHEVDSDPAALDAIKGDAVALARKIIARNESFRGELMQNSGMFEALMRQATGLAKAPYVAEFVRILIESGNRVVLFGWHRQVYAIWAERLADLKPVFYTGDESATQKEAARQAFITGESPLLIMSLRSGAGVDGLQGVCNTVVFGELDWSPGAHEQCIGRVHRDGQSQPTIAYFLTATDGSDPIMVEVLGVKREQIEGVRNPGQGLIERVDTGEHHLRRLANEFLARQGDTSRSTE